jgi:hypothetical protein
MSADKLLSRVDRVRPRGAGRWIARCPAHEDRSPSLSVHETDDGRVLVHCFAGCSVDSVVGAVGLDLKDLFPPRPIEHAKRERRPFSPGDVLACVIEEARIIAVAAANLRQGVPLNDDDYQRLMLAAERLEAAGSLVRG